MPLLVYADDTVRGLVLRGYEYGFAGNSVHVHTRTRLEVVKVNETKFCDKEDNAVLFRDLHRDGEIVCGLRREEYVDGLLREYGVRGLMIDFNNVQLCRECTCQRRALIRITLKRYLGPSGSPDREREELCRELVPVQLQLRKRSCMPFESKASMG